VIRRAERCLKAAHPVADGLEHGLLRLLSPGGQYRRPGLKLDPEHHLRGLHLGPQGNFLPGVYVQRIIQHTEEHLAEHDAVGQNTQRFLRSEQGQSDARALRPPLERPGHTLQHFDNVYRLAGDLKSAEIARPFRLPFAVGGCEEAIP